jgi:hypothetical protein
MTTAVHEDIRSVSGASITEAIAGIVAIVLTILGLAHVAPMLLVAIATIAVGVALFVRGGNLASEIAHVLSQAGDRGPPITELGGGSSWAIEFLAGAAGIVLGILALLRIAPTDLIAIACVAFGAALVLTSNAACQVNVIKLLSQGLSEPAQRMAVGVLSGSVGIQAVAGLQAIVLGILALADFNSLVLVLIALLALGSFIFVNGSALGGTVLAVFRR